MAATCLFVAHELRLFEHLGHGPATLHELSKKTTVPAPRLRIIADAMVALKLLERRGAQYVNSAAAAAYLSGLPMTDLSPVLRWWHELSYPSWMKLIETVRTGRPAARPSTVDQEKAWYAGMEALTERSAEALARQYEFEQQRRLLDIGHGAANYATWILRRHAHLRATFFEQPHRAAQMRWRFKGTEVEHRVTVLAGDCLDDAIPTGHDVILLGQVVHFYGPDRVRRLLAKLRASVDPGARLLLVDYWTDPTHTDPFFAALMAAEFLLATGEGDVYSEEEIRGWLQETRWRMLRHEPLSGSSSLIVAEAV
ncbi:methyltransferase [Candidatus Nitrospira bockiana]